MLRRPWPRPTSHRGNRLEALARDLGVPPNRITAIISGTRGITADTAVLLGKRFGTSGRFWMNLQVNLDLALAERRFEVAA